MSNKKHTPGPWKKMNHAPSVISGWFVANPDRSQWPIAANMNEADASLVAAAPDLLEALKKLTSFAIAERDCLYESMEVDDGGKPVHKYDRDLLAPEDARIDLARAAIAKATGEQS